MDKYLVHMNFLAPKIGAFQMGHKKKADWIENEWLLNKMI
jgi:hypothetical protein